MDKTWAIVELMGHSQIVGEISEEEIASQMFLRVDVPENGDIPTFTKFYGATAIYAITPTNEETARFALARMNTRPVAQYILPHSLPTPDEDNEDDWIYEDITAHEDKPEDGIPF